VAIAVLTAVVGAFAVVGALNDDNSPTVKAAEGGQSAAEKNIEATTGATAHDMSAMDSTEHADGAHDMTDPSMAGMDHSAEHSSGGSHGASHSASGGSHDAAHGTGGGSHDAAHNAGTNDDHSGDHSMDHSATTTPGDTTSHEHSGDHNMDHSATTIPGDTTPTTGGHEHNHDPGTTIPGDTTPTTAHQHHDGPNVQLTDLPGDIQAQVYSATLWAMQYDTTAKATAAGFPKLTTYFPGIAAHYINLGRLFDNKPFNPAEPEVLLFNGTDANAKLVGINYIVYNGNTPPEGFPGDYDQWHEHPNLCMQNGIVVGEAPQGSQCPAGQSTFSFKGYWLLHVWSIPGWESPEGIFSHENSKV
jgi:hypothetical protein